MQRQMREYDRMQRELSLKNDILGVLYGCMHLLRVLTCLPSLYGKWSSLSRRPLFNTKRTSSVSERLYHVDLQTSAVNRRLAARKEN